MLSILSVGNDAPLTQTRGAVLATALKASVIVADAPAALLLLRDHVFDLVVLCHTVTAEQAAILMQAAHNQTPPAKTLIVDPLFSGALSTTKSGERRGPSADPAVLVFQVRQLLAEGDGHPVTRPHELTEKSGLHLTARDHSETPAI